MAQVSSGALLGGRALLAGLFRGQERRFATARSSRPRVIPSDGKTLGSFMREGNAGAGRDDDEAVVQADGATHYLAQADMLSRERRTFRLETYGCQMNVSDSEIVRAVLLGAGYEESALPDSEGGGKEEADVVLLNTCAIRDKAEQRIWNRLRTLRQRGRKGRTKTTIGVLGAWQKD